VRTISAFVDIDASETVATVATVALARVRTLCVDTGSIVIAAITAIVALVIIYASETVTAVTVDTVTRVASNGVGAHGVLITRVL